MLAERFSAAPRPAMSIAQGAVVTEASPAFTRFETTGQGAYSTKAAARLIGDKRPIGSEAIQVFELR